MQVAMAGSIGVVLALCVLLLLFLARKHPRHIKAIFLSFVRMCLGLVPLRVCASHRLQPGTEVKLALKIIFGTPTLGGPQYSSLADKLEPILLIPPKPRRGPVSLQISPHVCRAVGFHQP